MVVFAGRVLEFLASYDMGAYVSFDIGIAHRYILAYLNSVIRQVVGEKDNVVFSTFRSTDERLVAPWLFHPLHVLAGFHLTGDFHNPLVRDILTVKVKVIGVFNLLIAVVVLCRFRVLAIRRNLQVRLLLLKLLVASGHFLRGDRHGAFGKGGGRRIAAFTSFISSKGINLIILGGEPGLELRGQIAKLPGELFLKFALAHLVLSPYT